MCPLRSTLTQYESFFQCMVCMKWFHTRSFGEEAGPNYTTFYRGRPLLSFRSRMCYLGTVCWQLSGSSATAVPELMALCFGRLAATSCSPAPLFSPYFMARGMPLQFVDFCKASLAFNIFFPTAICSYVGPEIRCGRKPPLPPAAH